MYVVDASVFISRLVPGDKNYIPSQDWFRLVRTQGSLMYSPNLLLPEVAGPISRLVDSTTASWAVAALGRMRRLRLVRLDGRLARRAAQLAGDLRLRGADSVYVAVAHLLGMALVTWDSEQQTRGIGAVAVRSPADLVANPGFDL